MLFVVAGIVAVIKRSCLSSTRAAAAITPSAIKLALHCMQSTTATTARTATATTTIAGNNCDDNVDAAVGKCLLNLRPALTSSASTSASASALRQRWVCAASTVAPDRVTAASKLGALALTTLAANESPKINMPFSSRLGCKSIWKLIGGHMTKPLSTLTGGQLGHFIDSGSSHQVGAYHAIQLQLPIVARTLDRVTRELCV